MNEHNEKLKEELHKMLHTSGWGEDEDNLSDDPILLQAALAEAVAYGKIMQARAEKAEAERDALKARNARLVALVRKMEWGNRRNSDGPYHTRTWYECHYCKREKSWGHAPDCPIAAEITELCGEE